MDCGLSLLHPHAANHLLDPRIVPGRSGNAHLNICCPYDTFATGSTPIHDVPAAPADPHTQHRGMVVEIGDGYRGVASPIKLSRTPTTYRVKPPTKDDGRSQVKI